MPYAPCIVTTPDRNLCDLAAQRWGWKKSALLHHACVFERHAGKAAPGIGDPISDAAK